MDFWVKTNWFAIQAKPYQESLAAAHTQAVRRGEPRLAVVRQGAAVAMTFSNS
jgi:hypothetical protein